MFHRLLNQGRAMGAILWGAPSFSKPRMPPPIFMPVENLGQLSFYDVCPLKARLDRPVDFDRLNSGAMRLSVGATHGTTGNSVTPSTGRSVPST